MRQLKIMAVLLTAIVLFGQCTKPTVVGGDLLGQDESELARIDTFTLVLQSVPFDTVATYDQDLGPLLVRHPLGHLVDPVFGTSKTTVYFEVVPSYGFNEPDFTDCEIDSLVLAVFLDTSFVVGQPLDPAYLEVYRMLEALPDEDLDNTREFTQYSPPVGTYNGPIWPAPLATTIDYIGSVDTQQIPQLRIRLDDQIGLDLMALDSTTLVDDTLFIEVLRGFALRFPDPVDGYIGLFINNPFTRLQLYTTQGDTLQQQTDWVPATTRVTHLYQDVDRSSSPYATLIDQNQPTDTLHPIQGMTGYDLAITMPHIQDFPEDILVNLATLEFTVCDPDGLDGSPFGPLSQVEMYTYDAAGEVVLIDDVRLAFNNGLSGLAAYFGGVPIEEGDPMKIRYRCNISAHLQRMLGGDASNTIYLRPRSRENTPQRITVCGNGSQDPPKLTVTYTKLNP